MLLSCDDRLCRLAKRCRRDLQVEVAPLWLRGSLGIHSRENSSLPTAICACFALFLTGSAAMAECAPTINITKADISADTAKVRMRVPFE